MDNTIIRSAVESAYDEILALRRQIHENPELGNKEYKTAALIKGYLMSLGIEAESVLETGVVATIKCGTGEGPAIALRADIDALPIREETGLPYASQNMGIMHACGHDIHAAALLGVAKVLTELSDQGQINGTVRLIFQPDEEGNGGARRMIQAGVLENPRIEAVYGIHIRPEIEAGKVAVKYGKSYAASDMFEIEVKGKSCHGAEPENGISPIRGAAQIVADLDGLASTVVPEGEKAIISIGSLLSGTAGNIIPERAVIKGIIRTLGQDSRQQVKNVLASTVKLAGEKHNCGTVIKLIESYPGVVNHDADVSLVYRCVESLFGEAPIVLDEPTMTTEDFGYFLMEREGAFYHIGAGSEYPLHNSKLAPSEEALKTAVLMHVKLISERLGSIGVVPVQEESTSDDSPNSDELNGGQSQGDSTEHHESNGEQADSDSSKHGELNGERLQGDSSKHGESNGERLQGDSSKHGSVDELTGETSVAGEYPLAIEELVQSALDEMTTVKD